MNFSIAANNQLAFTKLSNNDADIAKAKETVKASFNSATVNEKIKNNAVVQTVSSPAAELTKPGLSKPTVDSDNHLLIKRLEQLGGSDKIASVELQKNEMLTLNSDKDSTINANVRNILTGYSAKFADVLQMLIEMAQKSFQASKSMQASMTTVQHAQGYASANSTREAGVQQFNKDVTSSSSQMAMGIGGGAAQIKGLNKSIKVHTTHGNNKIELNHQADKLSAQAMPTTLRGKLEPKDSNILMKTANNKRLKAAQEDNFLQTANLSAQKTQAMGGLVANNAYSVAQMTSSGFTVAHAEKQADVQRHSTDQNVMASAADTKSKDAESTNKMLSDFLALLLQMLDERTSTFNTMIRG